jgi:hypothetical protein
MYIRDRGDAVGLMEGRFKSQDMLSTALMAVLSVNLLTLTRPFV